MTFAWLTRGQHQTHRRLRRGVPAPRISRHSMGGGRYHRPPRRQWLQGGVAHNQANTRGNDSWLDV
jgi:hypothetical protein